MSYRTILYDEDGPVGTITLNRPDDGNMFTIETCHEVRDCIDGIRRETRTRAIVLTGAGTGSSASAGVRTERSPPASMPACFPRSRCTRRSTSSRSR